MAKARGSIERKRKLEKLPYIVECPRPSGGGVWRELDDLEAWARRACGADGYMTTSREVRREPAMPRYVLRVHFGDEAKARAFAREFGLSYP
jgi:hypothetical protein